MALTALEAYLAARSAWLTPSRHHRQHHRGDILRPLMMGLLVTLLLILRIPPVRKWASALKNRVAR